MRVYSPLYVLLLLCWGCEKPASSITDASSFRKPTAIEAFNLKTICVELGAKINKKYDFAKPKLAAMSETAPLLTQEQFSHYDPKTNRCYVELRVTVDVALLTLLSRGNANAEKIRDHFLEQFEIDYMERHLYNGQTGEELAFFQKGIKRVPPVGSLKDRLKAEWYEASTTIEDLMGDDRRQ